MDVSAAARPGAPQGGVQAAVCACQTTKHLEPLLTPGGMCGGSGFRARQLQAQHPGPLLTPGGMRGGSGFRVGRLQAQHTVTRPNTYLEGRARRLRVQGSGFRVQAPRRAAQYINRGQGEEGVGDGHGCSRRGQTGQGAEGMGM